MIVQAAMWENRETRGKGQATVTVHMRAGEGSLQDRGAGPAQGGSRERVHPVAHTVEIFHESLFEPKKMISQAKEIQ